MTRGSGVEGVRLTATTAVVGVVSLILVLAGCMRMTPSGRGEYSVEGPGGVALEESVRLHGRLVDADGDPVVGAELRYVPDAATLMAVSGAVPERDGEFEVAFPGFAIDEVPVVVTGPDGLFEFETRRSMDRSERNWNASQVWSSAALVVNAPGFATRLLRHHWTQPPDRDFGDVPLDSELAVAGVVVDEGGEPIADARVRVEHSGTWDELKRDFDLADVLRLGLSEETTTGPDGRFRLGGLSGGGHHFSIEANGFGRAVSWIAGANGMTVDLGRVPLDEVEGICGVVRSTTGDPLPDARIWLADAYFDRGITPGFLAGPPLREGREGWTDPLTWAFRERRIPHVTSGPDGEFCAFGSGGPAYDLYAVADGYVMSRLEDVRDGRSGVEVDLEPRTTPVAPDPYQWTPIEDPTVGTISITVRDEAGRPVSGAAVFTAQWSFEKGDLVGETDEDGVLAAEVRRQGASVVFARQGAKWSERGKLDWQSASEPSAALTLVETGGIVGVALRQDGEIDPYAWLSLTPLDVPRDLHPNRPDVRADADGRFEFVDLLPGRYEVRSDFSFQGWEGTEVTVRSGGSSPTTVQMKRSVPRLRGAVTSRGEPVVWAKVEGRLIASDERGYYASWSLRDGVYDSWVDPAGEYDLTVETVAGGRLKATRVTVGEGEVATADFQLPSGGVVGTVVERANRAPVGGVVVGLFDVSNEYVARATDFTDAEGRFEFSELDDGEYVVRTTRAVWSWPDYAGQTFPMADARAQVEDGGVAEVLLAEPESAAIRGSVSIGDGQEARDGTEVCVVRVDVDPPDLGPVDPCDVRTYTRGGEFVARGLPPGVYRLGAEVGDLRSDQSIGRAADLSTGGDTRIDLEARGSARPRSQPSPARPSQR